jgi:hypothetical protein
MGIRRIGGPFIVAGLLSFGAVLGAERVQSVIAFQGYAGQGSAELGWAKAKLRGGELGAIFLK